MIEFFIKNAIITKYGQNRLNKTMYAYSPVYDSNNNEIPDNLIYDPNFNFTKIMVSNIQVDMDINTTELGNEIYPLYIDSVELHDNVFTVKTTIDKGLEGLYISQIGLYENIDGEDHLFIYGTLNIEKPIVDYELTLHIEVNLENVQMYRDYVGFEILEPQIANTDSLEKFMGELTKMYQFIQHPIYRNLTALIHPVNSTQTIADSMLTHPINNTWDKEVKKQETVEVLDILDKHNNICNIIQPTNTFMFTHSNLLNYTISNLDNISSYLTVGDSKFTSTNDTCLFTNNNTIVLIGEFNRNSGILLNKINPNTNNFNFKIEIENNNDLVMTLGTNEKYLKYVTSNINWGLLNSKLGVHTFTFNNNTIKYYYNGIEQNGDIIRNNFSGTDTSNGMVLSNYISNGSDYNNTQRLFGTIFFNECLTQQQIQKIDKIIDYGMN